MCISFHLRIQKEEHRTADRYSPGQAWDVCLSEERGAVHIPWTVLLGPLSPGKGAQTPHSHMENYLQRSKLTCLQPRTEAHSACPGCRAARPWRAKPDPVLSHIINWQWAAVLSAITGAPGWAGPGPAEGRSLLAGEAGMAGICCISLYRGPMLHLLLCRRPRSKRGEGCLWHLMRCIRDLQECCLLPWAQGAGDAGGAQKDPMGREAEAWRAVVQGMRERQGWQEAGCMRAKM